MEALILWIVCAIAGGMIYQSKNRPFVKGFLWGLLLGFVGVIVTLCKSKINTTEEVRVRNNMSKEDKTLDNAENGNDFIADVNGSDFWVECNVCKQQLKNWIGSTPCCGSIAYIVEDGKATTKVNLFASSCGEPAKPTVIDLGKK